MPRVQGTLLVFGLSMVVVASGAIAYVQSQLVQVATPAATQTTTAPLSKHIAASGRLAPAGDIIHLSAGAASPRARIDILLVHEGDRVRRHQLVAVLDSWRCHQAAVKEAKEQASIAESELARVKAGTRAGNIAAQKFVITRLSAELQNAEREYDRYKMLYAEGAVSASMLDSKKLLVDTTSSEKDRELANLDSISEVRTVDVEVAQAQLDEARSQVESAEAALDLDYVRSPCCAEVLKINTHAGEIIAPSGIIDLGGTQQMYAIAEICESDIDRVRLGQKATVYSDALGKKFPGTVCQIGLQIGRKDLLDTDPAADVDARVVETKVRLSRRDSVYLKGLTNMRVRVTISQEANRG